MTLNILFIFTVVICVILCSLLVLYHDTGVKGYVIRQNNNAIIINSIITASDTETPEVKYSLSGKDKNASFIEVKLKNSRSLFIYSAIADPTYDWSVYTKVIITAWDNTLFNNEIRCCFLYSSRRREQIPAVSTGPRGTLAARQYHCKLQGQRKPVKVTLTDDNSVSCSETSHFSTVYYPKQEPGKFAICTKIAYGHLNPLRLIEWFEYQKLVGVDSVITYINDVDTESMAVFSYYVNQGFLNIYPFDLPGIDNKTKKRGFEEHRRINENFMFDERISTFDCQARMRGFTYASVMDFDEFVVANNCFSIKRFVHNTFLQNPRAAGMRFHIEFFISDWGKSKLESNLSTSSYVNRTSPRWERMKNIYIPSRIIPSSVTTHDVAPKPFYTLFIVPPKNATIHHYRKCPAEWKKFCYKMDRFTDLQMEKYESRLDERTKEVIKYIIHSSK